MDFDKKLSIHTKNVIMSLNEKMNKDIEIPEDLSMCIIPDKSEIKEISWKSPDEIKELTTNYTIKSFFNFKD